MKDGGESLSESQNPYLGGKSNKTHKRLFASKTLSTTKNPTITGGVCRAPPAGLEPATL